MVLENDPSDYETEDVRVPSIIVPCASAIRGVETNKFMSFSVNNVLRALSLSLSLV